MDFQSLSGSAEELEERLLRICSRVREEVRPLLGTKGAKGIGGVGSSGDATFGIDEVAEGVVERELNSCEDVAYYTEDRGLVTRGDPEILLVIDPIDGTRPAAAGLEACCVSIAAASYGSGGEPTLGDVHLGVVAEIKGDGAFLARRGEGARIRFGDELREVELSDKTDTGRLFWTIGFRGRPALPLVLSLGELIDRSSVKGGVFDLGSATFCISRVITGELDAYVDVGDRLAGECEDVRKMFMDIGGGHILNNSPYDLAAIVLIAEEAGAIVRDAYGERLDSYPLLPQPGREHISCLVAGNQALMQEILEQVERGSERVVRFYTEIGSGGGNTWF